MLKKIVSTSKKLISINSSIEHPNALHEILETAISPIKGYNVEYFERNANRSVLIYNSKKRPSKFKIILNGHLDIVPGKEYQYKPYIKNDRLYGVGALDMKASAVCLIEVFKKVVNKVSFPLAIQLVTDEEVGGFDGTKYQIEKGVKADFVITGESTSFNIANKAKGILLLKIKAKGKSAHGAYVWNGTNAISIMSKFVNNLEKAFPIPKQNTWVSTVNISKIETSNISFNKVPDDCTVSLDIRYIPGDIENVLKKIRNLLPKELKIIYTLKEPSMDVNANNQNILKLSYSVNKIMHKKPKLYGANGSSDARHYTSINCPAIEFGPIGGGIGSDSEWISIKSLEKYVLILQDFLLSI